MNPRKYPDSVLVSYGTKGKLAAFPPSSSQQIYLYNARAYNNTASAINVGILALAVTGEYSLYRYVDSGATYTNVTTSISAGTSIFAGANNDGYVVQWAKRFGMVGLTVSSAGAGGVFTYKYWNGSAFTTLTTLENPADYSSTGDKFIVFQPPSDWVVGGPTGVDPSRYSIFVQSTTAPGSAVSITNMWLGHFLEFVESVASKAYVQVMFPPDKPYVLSGNSGLIPYFSTAGAANQFAAYYSITG